MIKTLPLEKAIYVIKTDRKLGMILLHSKIKQSRTINQKSETKIFNFKTMQVQVQESSIMWCVVNTSLTIRNEVPANNNTALLPLIKIAILSIKSP